MSHPDQAPTPEAFRVEITETVAQTGPTVDQAVVETVEPSYPGDRVQFRTPLDIVADPNGPDPIPPVARPVRRMPEGRLRATLGTAAAVAAAAIYAFGGTTNAQAPNPHPKSQGPVAVATYKAQTPTITASELAFLDDTNIPPAVIAAEQRTVGIFTPTEDVTYVYQNGKKAAETDWGWGGSGEELNFNGETIIGTAAHVLGDPNIACANTTISYLSPFPNTNSIDGGAGRQTPGLADPTHYDAFTYNGGNDAAVVIPKVPYTSEIPLQLQADPDPAVGTEFFTLGYGGRGKYSHSPDNSKPDNRTPYVIRSIVVGDSQGKIEVITKPNSDIVHSVQHGDSGGPGVDANGNYYGETVASDFNTTTVSGLESRFGLTMPDVNSDEAFTVSYIQPVSVSSVNQMLTGTEPCTQEPLLKTTMIIPNNTDLKNLPVPPDFKD